MSSTIINNDAANTTNTTDTTRTPFVFEIREEAYGKLVERFAKMVKRARKCNLPAPRFEIVHEAEEQKTIRKPFNYIGLDEPSREAWVKYLYVTVEGERPTIAGWNFVATIDHAEDSNIIRGVPGSGNIPVEYRSALPVCNHCNTARRRNETFVLRNISNGSYKQVGRNCLADFFPGYSPEDVVKQLEWWVSAVEILSASDDDGDNYGMGGGETRFGLESFVANVAKAIDQIGWKSRTQAREEWGSRATVDAVLSAYGKPTKTDEDWLVKLRNTTTTDKNIADATAAIEWARSIDAATESDYFYNLLAVCRGESITRKNAGLVASVIAARKRVIDGERKKAEKAARPESNHVGTIGYREVFHNMTLFKIGMPSESDWGVSTLMMFRDEAGNLVKWFMSDSPDASDWKEGEVCSIVATPKKHGEYRGDRETVVNRVAKWDGKWKAKKVK